MNENLNLITSEEKFEQRTSLIFKIVNVSFIIFLFITVVYSVYSFLEFNKLKAIENNLIQQKSDLSNKINQYSSEEKLLRDVIHRFGIYKNFHSEIEDFSEIVKEIYFRAAGTNVEIMTINFSYEEKEASIRVKSSSEQFTRFVNNLKNTDFKGPNTLYPNIFYPSPRNEEVDQAIKEYIVYIKYKPEVLIKK